MVKRNTKQVEFGDFQTPVQLAESVVQAVAAQGDTFRSIVEPTCGVGSFIVAALRQFESSTNVVGVEINPEYFKQAQSRVVGMQTQQQVDLRQADFFTFNWPALFRDLPEPILVIGNPPWVTISELSTLQSKNMPVKSNFQNRRGLDAITGKSNFDIAEWILVHLLEWLSGKRATVAMLLKNSVARKVLFHAWKESLPLADAKMYAFDAKKHFNVSVEACLLVCDLRPGPTIKSCELYDLETPHQIKHTIAFHNGMILADLEAFERHEDILQDAMVKPFYRWRSGVKHDCSRVMELTKTENGFVNGYGEEVVLELDYLYPMLKGSGVANGGRSRLQKYMIVTQRETGQLTAEIERSAPRTWAYLNKHSEKLDRRGSSIYKNRPRFSVFGVGGYTFAPWKVAICGFYKRLEFAVLGPQRGKPVVVDDTVYFISCESEGEANVIAELLSSNAAQDFLGAFIFWDAKRPITADVLARLDIIALAEKNNRREDLLALRPAIKSQFAIDQSFCSPLF